MGSSCYIVMIHYNTVAENQVLFTYSVQWEVRVTHTDILTGLTAFILQVSEVAWASRWDTYLHMSDVEV